MIRHSHFTLITAALVLSACNTVHTPAAAPPPPSSVTNAVSQPSFDVVTKGAERQDGLLPIWKRQDKLWIELSPQAFDKPMFLSPKLSSGIGEAGIFGGLMQSRWAQVGRPQWVEFRKVQQQVQLLAINAAYTAQTGTPQAKAVQAAFSPSLLSSVPLASAPQSKSGAVLIDASALLLGDMLGIAQHLQRTYRQSYALDARNSAMVQSKSQSSGVAFEVSQHYATSSIATGANAPGTPNPSLPLSVPDPRSLFVTVHYSLSALPEKPMPTRPADPRVGYFTSTVADFTNDLARTPRQRFINKWRLDKKDPLAALSEPVQPIVYWLDPSIPLDYREAITEGILEWNKAFNAIGFKQAIEVKTPPADQPFDTLATGQASIRWMTNSQPAFGAIGPTHVDPRTGEILDADIALESLSSRAIRTVSSQFLANTTQPTADTCQHGDHATEQLGLALEVMAAQDALDPDSPKVKAFVLAYLKDTTMHEVGHTLGLRHNFRASRWHTASELADLKLTQDKGNSASVMDYAPINLPAPGQPSGSPFQSTLGPYDYWAIEYGYTPMLDNKEDAQHALQDIARRSARPDLVDTLAFGTDEDQASGLDPQALTFDLGRDPAAFAQTRLAIVRDLFERQATRALKPNDDPTLLMRSVLYGLRDLARTSQILMRQIGGVVSRRDAPGSGRDLIDPLPAAQQRVALDILTREFLSPKAIGLKPVLLRQLAPDYMDRQEPSAMSQGAPADFSLANQQLAIQRTILATLMSEPLSERLMDNIDKTGDRDEQPLTVNELHRRLHDAIWSTTHAGSEPAQRDLQREHVNRLAAAIVRGGSNRADVRAIFRANASALLSELRTQHHESPTSTAYAHRRDCIDTLSAALSASVVRSAP
ncbi:MAG: zinc-dependent metalloprotease [Aquabacterium sp.]|nr:zinc-dependent metalloprotease [Aquabacterium sp.]